MKYKDYYAILGVNKTSTQADIKKAYRALAKKHHPDANLKNKTSDENFKEINEAYEVLGNIEKRKKYDELGNQANFQNGDDFDPNQTGFKGYRHEKGSGYSDDFSDFFNAFFGGKSNNENDFFRGRRTSNKRYRSFEQDGSDSEAEISITPEEGFHGYEMRVGLKVDSAERKLSFKVPAGIRRGEKIKLSGQGTPGQNGGKDGDLYIKVNFSEDGRFKLNGLDLEMSLDLTPWDAALGSERTVRIMDDTILLKTPQGIQTGGKIRVAGKGYKDRNDNRGDLYIKVRIVNPKVLSGETQRFVSEDEKVKQIKSLEKLKYESIISCGRKRDTDETLNGRNS